MKNSIGFILSSLFALNISVAQIAVEFQRTPLKGKVQKVQVKNYMSKAELESGEPFFSYIAEYDEQGNDTSITQYMNYSGSPEKIGYIRKEYDHNLLQKVEVYDVKKGTIKSISRIILPTYDKGKLIHEQHLSAGSNELMVTIEYPSTSEKDGIQSGTFAKREYKDGVWIESNGEYARDSVGLLFFYEVRASDTLANVRRNYHTGKAYSYYELINKDNQGLRYLTKSEVSFDEKGNPNKIVEKRKDMTLGKTSDYYIEFEYQYEGEAELHSPYTAPKQDIVSQITDGAVWKNDEHQLLLRFEKTDGTKNWATGIWYSQFSGEKPHEKNWLSLLQANRSGNWSYRNLTYSKLFKIQYGAGHLAASLNPPVLSGDTLFLETSGRNRETVLFFRTQEGFGDLKIIETEEVEMAKPDVPAGRADDEILEIVEQPAEFAGGHDALNRYMQKNLKRPANAPNGKVFARFVVEKDGSVSEATILRGLCDACDAEVLRVVRSFPKFQPAKQQGRAVRTYFTLPVRFSY